MPAPTAYDRQYNFQNFQASQPASPLPGDRIDSEYNAVKLTLDEIIANLGRIQRADGRLANQSVGVDQLDASVALGITPPAAWETTHNYVVANSVFHGSALYVCAISHTSNNFSADLAAGRWSLLVDFDGVFTGPQGDAAVIAVGTTTTLAAGESATVVNSGTAAEAVFDFGIPQGDKGDKGDVGAEWSAGSGDPDNGDGADGDFYLQTADGSAGVVGDVWEKTSGAWSKTGNIRGASGSGSLDSVNGDFGPDVVLDADDVGALPADYLDTDSTLAANSDDKVPSQKAVKAYADALIAANDAMVFQGTQDCSSNPDYPAADRGDTYRVSVAGKIGGSSGVSVEVGDLFMCLTDSTSSGNQATVGANWTVIQTNIDGAVIGPSSATDGHLAVFDGATGKLIKDGGATSAFATAAQGSKADSALQSADIGDTVQAYDAQLFSNIPNASGDNNSSFTATRAAHASKHVGFYDSNDYTVTISTGQGFVAGDVVTLYNTGGATITIAQDTGITLISKDGSGSHTFGGPMMTIFFVSAVGAILSGDNLAAV